jgi:hypothetical protein
VFIFGIFFDSVPNLPSTFSIGWILYFACFLIVVVLLSLLAAARFAQSFRCLLLVGALRAQP